MDGLINIKSVTKQLIDGSININVLTDQLTDDLIGIKVVTRKSSRPDEYLRFQLFSGKDKSYGFDHQSKKLECCLIMEIGLMDHSNCLI